MYKKVALENCIVGKQDVWEVSELFVVSLTQKHFGGECLSVFYFNKEQDQKKS